jgi:NAD(P)-dependent dehydrogenase (short-subunit alcohol dehydrogenase family)
MRFEGKVVVVTGAAEGIGQAALLAFAREGARVVLADREPEKGQAIVEQLRREGREVLAVRVDVSVEDEVRALFDQVKSQWGRVDVLVNNAGIYMQGDVTQTSLADWERIMAVNVTGAFLCTRYAVPLMIAQKSGVIVNVASEAGLVGIKGQVVYNVSKGAMIALTRSCAVDLADYGIRVNSVCPGTTETPLVRAALQRAADPAEARRRLEQCRPANRLGTPQEIAAAILFLASDEVAYATGAILSVDGGYTAQ